MKQADLGIRGGVSRVCLVASGRGPGNRDVDLRIVITARFVCPDRETRLAGGREIHLRSLQAQALHVANSIFLGDYLTAEGQAAEEDIVLIRDNGFTILGSENGVEASPTSTISNLGAGTVQGANA
ncbi:Biotin and Thiamin Synthesis associated domain-containing protein [Brevibacterium sp. 239c]|uniref:hypothetical protein n=1 Tax=Brevibacterium sp. 239c TaxID=1965356 RepID=UPI000C3519BE|nr:Biotin and Thiamin Synthesis associated domain-containing protein [Brevibacterium sp. 239c]